MTFRCRGVRVTLSFWFFCGAVLLLSADRSGTAGLFFWAIALHEGGHLLYLRLARLPVGELRLSPLGLLLSLSAGCHPGPGQSLLLNLSGCAANLTAAALLLLRPGGGMAALRFSAVNTALGVLNLLPVPGLDGAQALEDLLVLLLGWQRGTALHSALMRGICLAGTAGCGWLLITRGFRLPLLCFWLIFFTALLEPIQNLPARRLDGDFFVPLR